MPYKNYEDHLTSQRVWKFIKQLRFFRSMGLEPTEIFNNHSDLECQYCLKITPRSCAHIFRHEPDCPHLPEVMEILGNPKTTWSRQPKTYAHSSD